MSTLQELEKEKLQLEISLLKKKASKRWFFVFQLIQMIAVILATVFALDEFVFKSREKEQTRISVTLDYISKVSDPIISISRDSLQKYQEMVYHTYSKKQFDSVFNKIDQGFERTTAPLSNYYNILQSGMDKGYFDKEMCYALLDPIATSDIELLKFIQMQHHGMRNDRVKPNYTNFKGLITFYVQIQRADSTKYFSEQNVPHYDIDKPFKYQRGRSSTPIEKGAY